MEQCAMTAAASTSGGNNLMPNGARAPRLQTSDRQAQITASGHAVTMLLCPDLTGGGGATG